MHFVDAKGILTGSGGYYGMNIYRGCTTTAYIVTAGASVMGSRTPLKTSK